MTDGFFGVDFYTKRMYPTGCKLTNGNIYYANAMMRIFKDGVEVANTKTLLSQDNKYSFIR